MTELIADLGRKLGEKWFTLLALPGLLYVATCVIAKTLCQTNALDFMLLFAQFDEWVGAGKSSGSAVPVLVVAALLFSVGAGMAAEALGSGLGRLWLAENWSQWPRPVRSIARRLVDYRTARWELAHAGYLDGLRSAARMAALEDAGLSKVVQPDLGQLYYPVQKISRLRPERPTWAGDRVNGVVTVLRHRFGLDVSTIWPSLWLTIPDETRKAIDSARDSYQRSTRLAGWAVLYTVVGLLWWPGLIVALVAAITAWRRGRVAIGEYCLLLEATMMLQSLPLAKFLGISNEDKLDYRVGRALTKHLGDEDVPS